MDMSGWLADQPGTTDVWWNAHARGVVPRVAITEFDSFVMALSDYTVNPTAVNLQVLTAKASELIDAIPKNLAPLSAKRRLVARLPTAGLRDKFSSSRHSDIKQNSGNLLLAIENLMLALGGQVIPKAYRDI